MPIEVLMPALSPTMEKGNLAKWLKKEGDAVKSGDVIAEIETDKATMEVEAVDEGTLGKILVAEGTADVAVNTPIAVLLGDGENASDIKVSAARAQPIRVDERARNSQESKAPDAPAKRRAEGQGRSRSPAANTLPEPADRPSPTCRKAPRWSRRRCARRCATRWPRRCGATTTCS